MSQQEVIQILEQNDRPMLSIEIASLCSTELVSVRDSLSRLYRGNYVSKERHGRNVFYMINKGVYDEI